MKRRNDKLHVWDEANKAGEVRWYWHLRSAYNGEIKCAGQPHGYARRANAVKGFYACADSANRGVELVDGRGDE